MGIIINIGALGHGLSVAVGLALSKKIDQKTNKVFSLLGDGDLYQRVQCKVCTTASKYQLDNLIVIIDRSIYKLQEKQKKLIQLSRLIKNLSHLVLKVFQQMEIIFLNY